MISIHAAEKSQLHQRSFIQMNGALDGIGFHLNRHHHICRIFDACQIYNVQMIQLAFVHTAIPRFIALFGLTEDHTQRIMMLSYLGHRLMQCGFIESLCSIQHHRLVEIMWLC
ncbi:hypothetical protein D1872_202780 [compost metagenome]